MDEIFQNTYSTTGSSHITDHTLLKHFRSVPSCSLGVLYVLTTLDPLCDPRHHGRSTVVSSVTWR